MAASRAISEVTELFVSLWRYSVKQLHATRKQQTRQLLGEAQSVR